VLNDVPSGATAVGVPARNLVKHDVWPPREPRPAEHSPV
jgi:serine acetyltransferase